ncbi:hypothetical protein ACF0H5_014212 [Mactra antiquata]
MGIGEVTVKKRKVIYDDYTGSFYSESKVESLQRQCDIRAKLTDVMNKAEEAKYKIACKQVNAEKHLFLARKEKATHRHSEALQDYKAHMNVLDKLAKERELLTMSQDQDIFGKYPPESIRNNIEELIDMELKEMQPRVRRRREATKLLGKRNEQNEVDRSKTTEDLFDELKHRKSRMPSPVKTPAQTPCQEMAAKPVPRLILPAITVRIGGHGNQSRIEPSDRRKKTEEVQIKSRSFDDNKMLPSVFVTDPRDSQLLR